MSVDRERPRCTDYLGHMLDAVKLARSYTEGLSKEEFLADKKTQQAVIMNIVVLGEAATKMAEVCADLIGQFPNLPWKQMRGMRNRLAHGYCDINLDIVWDTVQEAFPHAGNAVATDTAEAPMKSTDIYPPSPTSKRACAAAIRRCPPHRHRFHCRLLHGPSFRQGMPESRVQGCNDYGVVTLHRPSNVDNHDTLATIIGALGKIAERLPLILAVQPACRSELARAPQLSF